MVVEFIFDVDGLNVVRSKTPFSNVLKKKLLLKCFVLNRFIFILISFKDSDYITLYIIYSIVTSRSRLLVIALFEALINFLLLVFDPLIALLSAKF